MIPSEIFRKVRQVEIRTRKVVNNVLSGEYHSAFKGRGMEFSEVREYVPGDEIRTIDWNVTARSGRPFVKVYREERELTVMLVVDASASGDFGTASRMKGESAVEFCAVLAFSAIKNNDRVGLLICTSEVELFIPPKKGKNHVLRVIREMLFFKPRGRRTNLAGALSYLHRLIKKKAVIFLVSDFFDEKYERSLKVLSGKHDVVAVTIQDRRETLVPRVGLLEIEDAESGEELLIDTSNALFQETFARRVQEQARVREQTFRRAGVENISFFAHDDYVEPLVRFFKRREKLR